MSLICIKKTIRRTRILFSMYISIYIHSQFYTVTRYSTIYQHPVTPDNGHHGWVSRYTFLQVKWPCDFFSFPGLPPPLQAKVESTPRVEMTMPWWGNSLWMSWKWLLGGELSRHRWIVDIPSQSSGICTVPFQVIWCRGRGFHQSSNI